LKSSSRKEPKRKRKRRERKRKKRKSFLRRLNSERLEPRAALIKERAEMKSREAPRRS